MNYIILSTLIGIAFLFIFTSAFIRIKYLSKIYDFWNQEKNKSGWASKIKHWFIKIGAATVLFITIILLPFNLIHFLPIELEGMEYGISGDELQTLKWKHKDFGDSNFVDFVNDYKKFEHADVYVFAEARKLDIANYSVFLKHKEAIRQLERDEVNAKIELERRTKEAKLQEERKASEAERNRNSLSNYSSSPSTSSSFTREDPRNVYIYCVTGQLAICFTTPAECEQQKVFYGGQCKSVACGTTEAVLNTRQCAEKGFR